MRFIRITTKSAVLICLVCALLPLPDLQGAEAPISGQRLTRIQFAATGSTSPQNYLGLDGAAPFTIPQIKAKLVVVEFYSLYCPVCQKQALALNKLYKFIQNNANLRDHVKFMAIGLGNTENEINVYRKNFHVAFPLFSDPDKKIMQTLDVKYIPLTVLIDKAGKILLSHQGLIKDIDGVLSRIQQFYQQY